MVQKIDKRLHAVVPVVEVTLPAGHEVRYPRAKYRADKEPLEGFLAVEHVVEDAANELAVGQPPVVAELRRHVKDVVKLALHTSWPVFRRGDAMVA